MINKIFGEIKTSGKIISSKAIIILVVVAAIAISSYFYIQYQKSQRLLQNPTLAAAEEVKALVTRVSNLIELPKGEDPTVATVSDMNKLRDQPFFMNAQNGDKVLIYAKAKKAILYRPSINKIIEVAPVNNAAQSGAPASALISTPTSVPIPTLTPTPKIVRIARVAIYNGTKIEGLAASYEKQLKDKIANIEVVKKDNAKGDYSGILIVDLTGGNSGVAKQIASALNGVLGVLPKNEVKPDADILIILGK